MAATVSRQERQAITIQLADEQIIRGFAERTDELFPAGTGEPFDVVDAAAADDSEHCPKLSRHGQRRHL